MKAKLLASATQRSAVMERMQNVASTSAAATKPIPSMTDRSLIRLSFRLRWTLQDAHGGLTLFVASLPSRWQLPSDLGTTTLGLARQLSRTGAARLTDVCITAELGSVSHACVPLGTRKTFQKSDACSLATSHLGCEETSWNLEPPAPIERQNLIQVRLGSLRADHAQQGGARP